MGKRDNLLTLQAQQQQEVLKTQKAARKERSLAHETLMTLLGGPIQKALMGALDLSGIPKEWEETFAGPAMEAWWKYNAPGIRDEFAGIQGGFYSADRARGVSNVANQYYAQSVQPQLYSAIQQAKMLMPSMIGAVTNPLAGMATTGVPMPAMQMPNLAESSSGSLLGGLAGLGLNFLAPGLGTAVGGALGTLGTYTDPTGKKTTTGGGTALGLLGSMIGGL